MNALRGRLGPVAALAALLLLVSAIPSSQAHSRLWTTEVDLASVALAYEGAPTVTDNAFNETWRPHRSVQAETVATSTVDCDGCTGTATSLQILYLNRPRTATLDNVSTAWTSCAGCSTTTVSVQVVVVRSVRELRANNRAVAVSADCEECQTTSLAYQLVVVDRNAERLSSSARRELKAFVAEQAAQANAASAGARSRSAAPSEPEDELDSLAAVVNADLGSKTLKADVDQSSD